MPAMPVRKAILLYHSIDDTGSPISVCLDDFVEHLKFIRKQALSVVSLRELLDMSGPSNAVAITFDDGFESVYRLALPRLIAEGFPATIFAVTGFVGLTNAWDRGLKRVPEMPLMTWDELGMATEHGIDIGSHTHRHRDLTRLAPSEIEEEMLESGAEIAARLGVTASSFAYPYGRYDTKVTAIARRHFAVAVTTELRFLGGDDPATLPRLDCYYFRGSTTLDSWGSRALDWRLAMLRARRRAKGVLRYLSRS